MKPQDLGNAPKGNKKCIRGYSWEERIEECHPWKQNMSKLLYDIMEMRGLMSEEPRQGIYRDKKNSESDLTRLSWSRVFGSWLSSKPLKFVRYKLLY